MNKFTILLIEDQISITAQVVCTAEEHLHSYTLAIAKNSAEAIAEQIHAEQIHAEQIQHEFIQPQLILIGSRQLADASAEQTLSTLTNTYPQSPIFLLNTMALPDDQLINVLSAGVSNYYDLSPAGLLTLGRQLKILQTNYQEQESSIEFLLYQTISADTSDLAIQLISADYRVKAWNQATELFFNTDQDQAIGHLLDDLPLSTDNISRLKDILDQVFATNKPFFLPLYHFDGTEPNTLQQVQVHGYPIYSQNSPFTDICIIITPLETLVQTEATTLNRELQLLLDANRIISEKPELHPTLQKVIEQTKLLLHGDNCQIYLLEKDNKTFRPVLAIGPLAEQIQKTPLILGQGVLGQIAITGKTTIINHDSAKTEIPYPTNEHIIGTPLTSVGGTIGLIIVSRQSSPFAKDDLRFFE